MDRFVCTECGATFDEPRAVEESRGEFWGFPAYETMYYCPFCGGDFVKNEEFDEEDEEC